MSASDAAARPARDCSPRLTDYATERASYRLKLPERFNAVEAIVDRWAREAPDDPAVLSLDGTGEVIDLSPGRPGPPAWRSAPRPPPPPTWRGNRAAPPAPTVSGKIRRTELRGWLFDGRLPAGGASGVDGTGGGGTGGGAAG